MVRLHTSLLALSFVTGLVLASSDDYQRRDELFERDLDVEEFFGRQYDLLDERSDTFDEPEARGLFSGLFKVVEKEGEKVAKSAVKGRIGTVMKATTKTAAKLEHHGGKLEKQLKPARRLEKKLTSSTRSRRVVKRLKPSKKRVMKELRRAAKQANKNTGNNDNQNNDSQNRINRDLERARQEVADADRRLPPSLQFHVQSRGLEDDEELLRRDLEAEEVFGREYDHLPVDERDIFDDLD